MKIQTKKFLTIIMFITLVAITKNLKASGYDLIHDKTFQVNTGETLYLEGASGDVEIKSWDKNEVHVKIFGNDNAKEKLDFTLEKIDGGVKVKAEKKDGNWFSWLSSIKLKFEVMVPSEFNNDIKTAGGDIKFRNVNGKTELKTSGGDVEVKETEGDLDVRTSGGDIFLFTHKGPADLSTSGGDVEVVDLNGSISASTSGGNIKLDVKEGEIDASTSGGDVMVKYAGANMGIDLSTSGGDIKVALPKDFAADVKFRTTGGDISNKFQSSRPTTEKRGKYEGSFNGGGKKFECSTTGGDIIIREL